MVNKIWTVEDEFDRNGPPLGDPDTAPTGVTWVQEYGAWTPVDTGAGEAQATDTVAATGGRVHHVLATVDGGGVNGTAEMGVIWRTAYVASWIERGLRTVICWSDDANQIYLEHRPLFGNSMSRLVVVVGGVETVRQYITTTTPIDTPAVMALERNRSSIRGTDPNGTVLTWTLTEVEKAALTGERVGFAWFTGPNYSTHENWGGGAPFPGGGERAVLGFTWLGEALNRPALHQVRQDGLRGARYARSARTRQSSGWARAIL